MRTSSNVEVEAQENNGEERENCDLNVMEYRKWKSERICMNPRRHAGVGKKIPTGSVVGIFSLVVVCYQRANGLGIAIPGPD